MGSRADPGQSTREVQAKREREPRLLGRASRRIVTQYGATPAPYLR